MNDTQGTSSGGSSGGTLGFTPVGGQDYGSSGDRRRDIQDRDLKEPIGDRPSINPSVDPLSSFTPLTAQVLQTNVNSPESTTLADLISQLNNNDSGGSIVTEVSPSQTKNNIIPILFVGVLGFGVWYYFKHRQKTNG